MQRVLSPLGKIAYSTGTGYLALLPKLLLRSLQHGTDSVILQESIATSFRRKMSDCGKFKSGLQVMLQRSRDIIKISTHCAALDEILGGGIETSSLTELHGEYRQVLPHAKPRSSSYTSHR